jgi:hypothetical protein
MYVCVCVCVCECVCLSLSVRGALPCPEECGTALDPPSWDPSRPRKQVFEWERRMLTLGWMVCCSLLGLANEFEHENRRASSLLRIANKSLNMTADLRLGELCWTQQQTRLNRCSPHVLVVIVLAKFELCVVLCAALLCYVANVLYFGRRCKNCAGDGILCAASLGGFV